MNLAELIEQAKKASATKAATPVVPTRIEPTTSAPLAELVTEPPGALADLTASLLAMPTSEAGKSAPAPQVPTLPDVAPAIHSQISEAQFGYNNLARDANKAEALDVEQLWRNMEVLTVCLGQSGGMENAISDQQLHDAFGTVAKHLQLHPHLADVLLPEDIGLLTRSLATSAHVVLAAKTVNKKKRTGKAVEVNALAGQLAALGMGA